MGFTYPQMWVFKGLGSIPRFQLTVHPLVETSGSESEWTHVPPEDLHRGQMRIWGEVEFLGQTQVPRNFGVYPTSVHEKFRKWVWLGWDVPCGPAFGSKETFGSSWFLSWNPGTPEFWSSRHSSIWNLDKGNLVKHRCPLSSTILINWDFLKKMDLAWNRPLKMGI